MNNWAKMELISKSKNVGLARISVVTFAAELNFNLSELEEIKVAVSEAVTNCVIHAYPFNEGKIMIEMKEIDQALFIKIEDTGVGIEDIDAVLEPSYSTREGHMGLGLAFIDSFMDDFTLLSEAGEGTTIEMYKKPERIKKRQQDNSNG